MNNPDGSFKCDDPYDPTTGLRERWRGAIEAQDKGLPIQYLGYNNYGGHHYWNSVWSDWNRDRFGPVDWDEEIAKCKRNAFLTVDWRAKPQLIDPINPYTGDVSALAILKNIDNGHATFPEGMGVTIRPVIYEKDWELKSVGSEPWK